MTEVYYDFAVGDPRYPTLALGDLIGYGGAGGVSANAIPYLHGDLVMRLAHDGAAQGNQTVLTGGTSGFSQPMSITFTDGTSGIPILVRDITLSVGYVDSVSQQILLAYEGLSGGGDVIYEVRSNPPADGWQTVSLPYRNIGRFYVNSPNDSAGLGIKWIRFTLETGQGVPPRRIHPRDDGLAGSSTPRRVPSGQSEQGSNRVVGGFL